MVRQDALNIKSDGLNDKVYELDNQIVEVRLGNDSAAELGPLKYLSEVTGKSMDSVMKYFIFLLIIIGDPMAVLMVIIFNKIVKKDEDDEDILPAGNKLPKEVKEVASTPPTQQFFSEEELLGWEDCMRGKIVRHYGPEVEACVKSVTHSHSSWTSILKCIVAVKGITNPEIWIPEQIAYFTVWAAECFFTEEKEEVVEDTQTITVPVSNVTSDENIAKIVEQYSKKVEFDTEEDTEDQELLDYAKVDEIIAKEYLEDEEKAKEKTIDWVSEEKVVEALKEKVVEEPKVTIDDIKEKRQERERGFSVAIPERKKSNTVDRIGTNKEVRDGNSDAVYFKRRS
jgi:hypothetical protein